MAYYSIYLNLFIVPNYVFYTTHVENQHTGKEANHYIKAKNYSLNKTIHHNFLKGT